MCFLVGSEVGNGVSESPKWLNYLYLQPVV